MIMTQHYVITRGDRKVFTLTMPDGAQLTQADSVRFTARDADNDVVWEQTITPESDTVAVAVIGDVGSTDWDDWDAYTEETLTFDFEVVNADGEPYTQARGTIKVLPDVTR
jgi:hypothetical protein